MARDYECFGDTAEAELSAGGSGRRALTWPAFWVVQTTLHNKNVTAREGAEVCPVGADCGKHFGGGLRFDSVGGHAEPTRRGVAAAARQAGTTHTH
jgi:uncharacterized protein involved in high-affinity Fe2+ transport